MRVNNEYTYDQRVRREAEALAAAGYDVTVIADARPNLPAEEAVGGVRVRRVSKSSRIPYKSLIEPLRTEDADVYHAHDIDSLYPCLQAARLAKRGAKVIYDSHEIWSAHARDKTHARRRFLIRFEGRMLRRAAALISVSDGCTEYIAKRHHYQGPAVTVMNVSEFWPAERLADSWAARDARAGTLVAYAGVVQPGRGVVQLVRALEHLPADVSIHIIGPVPDSAYAADLRAAAAPFGDRVQLVGRIPADEIVPRLAESDVSAVLIEPISLSYRLSAPNKFFESMMAGTPVVTSDVPQLSALVAENDVGVSCDPSDPAAIAAAITGVLGRLPELRANTRVAAGRYTWDGEKRKLLDLYARLVGPPTPAAQMASADPASDAAGTRDSDGAP
jgi:glycosyltransferase involved in cell wall biosynthesis